MEMTESPQDKTHYHQFSHCKPGGVGAPCHHSTLKHRHLPFLLVSQSSSVPLRRVAGAQTNRLPATRGRCCDWRVNFTVPNANSSLLQTNLTVWKERTGLTDGESKSRVKPAFWQKSSTTQLHRGNQRRKLELINVGLHRKHMDAPVLLL